MPANRRAMLLLIVLSGTIISLCMGLRQSLGLFMRPMAVDFGIAAAGSLGTLFLAPLGQWLINDYGWQAALAAFAAVAASMALLSLPIREQTLLVAAAGKQKLGHALREAIAHRGYLFMTLAFFACGFQLVFITTHLPAYLQLCGVAPGVGASALALIGLFNTVGTYCFGLLGARYSQKHLLALIYLLRTLFIVAFLLVPVSAASTLVFAAAMEIGRAHV